MGLGLLIPTEGGSSTLASFPALWLNRGVYNWVAFDFIPPCLWFSSLRCVASYCKIYDFLPHKAVVIRYFYLELPKILNLQRFSFFFFFSFLFFSPSPNPLILLPPHGGGGMLNLIHAWVWMRWSLLATMPFL